MSYDVDIADKSFNYTSNVSKLFYDHIPDTGKGGGLRELAGVTGAEAVTIIAEAFPRLQDTRRKFNSDVAFRAEYDAPNGWGSIIGGLIFLGEILAACVEHPVDIVEVSL